jgi:DNA-binding transcriptional ArsR family regulator
MLRDGPVCVCEMAAALGSRENNVSNHLAKLRDAGLVRAGRYEADTRRVYYERDDAACRRRSGRWTDPRMTTRDSSFAADPTTRTAIRTQAGR